MKTNLRERSTRYQCVIRPKVHFAKKFSFKLALANGGKRREYAALQRQNTVKMQFVDWISIDKKE